ERAVAPHLPAQRPRQPAGRDAVDPLPGRDRRDHGGDRRRAGRRDAADRAARAAPHPARAPQPRARRKLMPGSTVIRALRADRALAIAFAVLACSALTPLFATPILPFPDLPSNVSCASLLVRTALHRPSVTQFYRIDWLPFPYWTSSLLVGVGSLLLGPFVASKLLVALIVVLLPLSLIRLALALGRDPRLGLWGFLISWDHNL